VKNILLIKILFLSLFKAAMFGLGTVFLSSLIAQSAIYAQINEGQSFFERSPRITRSATSFRNPGVLANYSVTINLPKDAKQSLKSVAIAQQPNLEKIVFYSDKTTAYLGEKKSDREIPIKVETAKAGEAVILLEKSLEPGQTITISLKARNPYYGGIYQFGVTAFPVGNQTQGIYIGLMRLHFSQPGGVL
jgi:hypothetical protein